MMDKLRVKAIYDDFIKSVSLTEEQIKILDMLIKKEAIVKISMEIGMSQRTVSYEIKKIKKLYEDYYQMQMFKMLMLID